MNTYFVYKLKAANPQYDQNSEIIIAHTSETNAIEMAEDITGCALCIFERLGKKNFNEPCVIENTFNS